MSPRFGLLRPVFGHGDSPRLAFGRCVGIGLFVNRIQLVVRQDRAIVHCDEQSYEGLQGAQQAIATLLSRYRRTKWRRDEFIAVIGSELVQVKSVAGLPPVTDPEMLRRVIQTSAETYFLSAGAPLAVSSVAVLAPGKARVAACSASIISNLRGACAQARVRLTSVTATWLEAPLATNADMVLTVSDSTRLEPVSGEVSIVGDEETGAAISDAEREIRDPGHDLLIETVLRHGRQRASTLGRPAEQGFAFPPTSTVGGERATLRSVRWRLCVVAASALIALLTPVVRDHIVARRATRAYASVAVLAAQEASDERRLARLDNVMTQIDNFRMTAPSFAEVLAEITRALPAGAHLVSVSFDSAGFGSVAGLALHADVVVDAIERTPAVTNAVIDGPVVEQLVAGQKEERTTVRFTLMKPPRR